MAGNKHGQHDGGVRVPLVMVPVGLDTAEARHVQVHEEDIGCRLGDQPQRGVTFGGLSSGRTLGPPRRPRMARQPPAPVALRTES